MMRRRAASSFFDSGRGGRPASSAVARHGLFTAASLIKPTASLCVAHGRDDVKQNEGSWQLSCCCDCPRHVEADSLDVVI